MLVQDLPEPSPIKTASYLRLVDLSARNSFSFFYIGKNEATITYLAQTFRSGFSAENFAEAQLVINSSDFLAEKPDVILIDLLYHEGSLQLFHTFLTYTNNQSIPVIYNEVQLPKGNHLKYASFVDDVFDIYNGRIDYASKVSFLKSAKSYQVSMDSVKLVEKPTALSPASCFYKRAFDILVASVLLLVLFPLLVLIAVLIKLESKGPVFYNAKRAGRGFRIFDFYKFRTMEVNADKKIESLAKLNQYKVGGAGPVFFKIANDPRITRVGKILRNTSLDELPQLFNVLKGDMSLVGNRPLPLYEASTLTTNEYVERFMAPSGITGLWQIKKRGKSDMSIDERINLDIVYARKSNLLYDFWIMARTPAVLLQKDNV